MNNRPTILITKPGTIDLDLRNLNNVQSKMYNVHTWCYTSYFSWLLIPVVPIEPNEKQSMKIEKQK